MVTLRWQLLAIVAGTAVGLWLLLPPVPTPPDFADGGFTSVRVEFRRFGESQPAVSASSENPAVVAELAEVLRTGKSVMVCRCVTLGSVEFRRPDGTSEKVLLVPAHDSESVEFRTTQGRFRVDRKRFLRAVESIGVPPARWYEVADSR